MPELATIFSPTILAVILALSILALGGFSAAFIYHWREYGMDTRLIRLAPILYLSVSAGLCAFALISFFVLV